MAFVMNYLDRNLDPLCFIGVNITIRGAQVLSFCTWASQVMLIFITRAHINSVYACVACEISSADKCCLVSFITKFTGGFHPPTD